MAKNGLSSRIVQFIDPDERQRAGVQSPFQRLALRMRDVSGDGGVLKELVHGGDGPLCPRNATVLIQYSGYLEYTDRPFETTARFKHPQMMKLGTEYAYGNIGCPPLIPPTATLLYEVHLHDFLDSAEVDAFFALSLTKMKEIYRHMMVIKVECKLQRMDKTQQAITFWKSSRKHSSRPPPLNKYLATEQAHLLLQQEQQNSAPLSAVLSVVNTERCFGNHCFNQKRYENAKDHYRKAMTLLRNRQPVDEEERHSIAVAKLPLLLNLSLALLRLGRPQKALEYGQKALEMDPENTKALFRCAQACLEMRYHEKAQDYLVMAQAKKPFDSEINSLLKKLAISYKDSLDKEKEMCSKMFACFNVASKK